MHVRTMSALVAALISTAALAQSAGGPAETPEPAAAPWRTPEKLSPEGKRWLEGLRGKWSSKAVKLTVGDRDVPGRMKIGCTKASGGWATLCKATFTAAGFRPDEDTYLLGWDLAAKQAHMFEVTNAAEVHDHVGTWTDDKTITVVHRGKNAEGEEEEAALTFHWASPSKLETRGTAKVGGKTTWSMSATFTK